MKRKLLIAMFSVGTVAGFGSGFAHMRHHHHRRAHFERHLADVCVEAARDAERGQVRVYRRDPDQHVANLCGDAARRTPRQPPRHRHHVPPHHR